MATLMLNHAETEKLVSVLASLEKKFGSEYSYVTETSAFSCKCSGPAQSCVWH